MELKLVIIFVMTYQPHVLSNIGFAGKYFEKLPSDDISRRYFSGEKYESSLASKLKILFATDSVLAELNKFYPYQPVINATYDLYKERKESNQKIALGISALGTVSIYSLAKQNIVLPFFNRFSKLLKVHRLFSQYLTILTVPYLVATLYTNNYFSGQAELLWAVHADRLNNKVLSDPVASQYPRELLPVSQVGSWILPHVHRYDLPKKWANETHIAIAPDYAEPEEWEKVSLAESSGEQGGQQAAEEE